MKLEYFGDSYDIVKKSLLHWLSDLGPWIAYPMFTHATRPEEVKQFENFLGIQLISTEVLGSDSDRGQYLACCGHHSGSLFLDPDTGIRLKVSKGRRAPEYLFADELIRLTADRPHALTLTFDQSLARGSEKEQIERKLAYFSSRNLHGFAYVSHASFVVLGKSADLVLKAHRQLLAESLLPDHRMATTTNATEPS